VRETVVVVVKRRVFPPLLCAIVLGVIPWRRFVSFRREVYRFEPKLKNLNGRPSLHDDYISLNLHTTDP